jgi:hypothetical protein
MQNFKLGILQLKPATAHPDLLAKAVADCLTNLPHAETVGVAEIDPGFSDTAAFCEHYKIEMGQAANCIVLETKRGEERSFAACVISASEDAK